jgi:import inner membrane translocase subunit TIM22
MPFWRRKPAAGADADANGGAAGAASSSSPPASSLEMRLDEAAAAPPAATPAPAPPATEPTPTTAAAENNNDDDVSPLLRTHLTHRFIGRLSPIAMPSPEQMQGEDLMNNCAVKATIAAVMGGLLGVAFGVFTASMDPSMAGAGIDAAPLAENNKTTRQVLRETAVLMRDKSVSYAKGFALMGAVYSSCECVIEKKRARHDFYNAPLAGCAAGGLMAAPGGAKAACFGCATFAAFSAAIEVFTGGH